MEHSETECEEQPEGFPCICDHIKERRIIETSSSNQEAVCGTELCHSPQEEHTD